MSDDSPDPLTVFRFRLLASSGGREARGVAVYVVAPRSAGEEIAQAHREGHGPVLDGTTRAGLTFSATAGPPEDLGPSALPLTVQLIENSRHLLPRRPWVTAGVAQGWRWLTWFSADRPPEPVPGSPGAAARAN